jgi:hypothetical protein
MPVAAANPAGGLAGAGVGLGMGLAMAGPTQRAAAPPAVPGSLWHVAEQGRATGPLGTDALSQAVAQGRVTRDTLVWCAGMAAWEPAANVPALAALFGPPPLP